MEEENTLSPFCLPKAKWKSIGNNQQWPVQPKQPWVSSTYITRNTAALTAIGVDVSSKRCILDQYCNTTTSVGNLKGLIMPNVINDK